MMKEYEKIFLNTVLGHDHGLEGVRYWIKGRTPRSESGAESALNAGVEAVAKALKERLDEQPFLENLLILDRFQPVTRKQSRARYFLCPGLKEAIEAHAAASAAVYATLPEGAERLLREDLRPAIWRARALKREPTTSITSTTSMSLELIRYGPHDEWVLEWRPLPTLESQRFTRGPGARVYVRLGHLSSRTLHIEATRQPAGDGREVTSVVVRHPDDRSWCHNPNCRLPVATEIIHGAEDDGGYRSLWRENTSFHEATLPHMGRKVRIGDVILMAVSHEDTADARAASAMFTLPTPKQLGSWEGTAFVPSQLPNPEDEVSPKSSILRFLHTDHYEVSVQVLPEEVVVAASVHGQTQYTPLAVYGD